VAQHSAASCSCGRLGGGEEAARSAPKLKKKADFILFLLLPRFSSDSSVIRYKSPEI
jgi:hypothetical protein